MFVITSKISDKTFSCAYSIVCIYVCIRHWHLKLQCAQHFVVASHGIVTSVFGVGVVAVAVLQLHTIEASTLSDFDRGNV